MAFPSSPAAPAPRTPPLRFALFDLGFRPFYLLAALAAALSLPVWIAQYLGWLPAHEVVPGIAWHAHEMVFGFAVATLTGFLFTAGRNWTGKPTPTGRPLAILALVWLAGRVLMVTGPASLAAVVDVAFVPLVAVGLGRALVAAGNRRNYFFLALLALLTVANACFHLAFLGVIDVPGLTPVELALFVIVTIVTVMGGRVIPSFTKNALPRARSVTTPRLDRAALVLTVLAFAAYLVPAPPIVLAPVALAAAAAQALRLARWDPLATSRTPILWILHLSYAWIPVGFALMGLAAITDRIAPALALHALSVGAVGGMIVGMMTRTARGHTGRRLETNRAEVAAYVLVHVAAAVRVFVPIVAPEAYAGAAAVAAVAWSLAFAIYAVAYWPVLARARLDGKPG